MWHTRHRFAYPHGGGTGAHHPVFTEEQWAEWKCVLKWGVIVVLLSLLLLSLPPGAK